MTEERNIAKGIAEAMVPTIETELKRRLGQMRQSALEAARPRVKVGQPVRLPPPAVLEAAVSVADAFDRLRQARFSREEPPARAALERRVEALSNAVRELQR